MNSATSRANVIVETVAFDAGMLELTEDGTWTQVRYPGSIGAESEGGPDLPAFIHWIEIPPDARVVAVAAEAVSTVELDVRAPIRPVVADRRPGDFETPTVADSEIYAGSGRYPGAWAELASTGAMRGHRLVAVRLYPARWERTAGAIVLATRLTLRVELTAGGATAMVPRHRVVPRIEARYEGPAAASIAGFRSQLTASGVQSFGGGGGPAGPGPFQPTFRPTTDGSPVEYVVITADSLAGEFQRLADWKTSKGVQAVVRTVEWIDSTYPNGIDRAERVRFFIRDAYQNWGTLWVLLGGDTDIVPPRYATFTSFGGELIPADYYYGCLDGNWNGDGDDRIGEGMTTLPGDDADLLAEVSVGRAPVSTVEAATGFVDKQLAYEAEAPSNQHYPASMLVMAEQLFASQHGAEIAEEAISLLPPWFKVVRLYEGSSSWPGAIELFRQAAIDSINNGFGVVLHVGHGYRNTMSVASGTLGNSDADAFVNGPRNSVVFSINCSSAAIDFNSIGERWVKNPNGGSAAYIGTSRLAFVGPAEFYQNAWFEAVFVDSVFEVGLASDFARLPLVALAEQDNSWRWNLMATTLLGDPEIPVHHNAIPPLAVTHPPSYVLGSGSLEVGVTAAGSPVSEAQVTLWRAGEAYGTTLTDSQGSAVIDFQPDSPGDVSLTVTRSPYRPYQTTIPAVPTADPFVHIATFTVDDDGAGGSVGDGDGSPDAGETVELPVHLTNTGGATAANVVATLSVDDPANAITLASDSVIYGSLAAGAQSAGSSAFVVEIDGAAPFAYQPVFTLVVSSDQGSWEDVFVIGVKRPYLEHYEHAVDDSPPRGNGNGLIEAGEHVWFTPTLRNGGQDRAGNVAGTLRALATADSQPHPLVTVLDLSSTVGDIDAGGIQAGDRFEFALDAAADPATVLLEVTWTDALGEAAVDLVDLIPPQAPDSVQAFGAPNSIRLRWKRPADGDVRGYDVFRSESPVGPFSRINAFMVEGAATFEDPDLPSLTRFYYQVVARDASFNKSVPSAAMSGTTNPPLKPGWPQLLGQESQSSVNFADVVDDPALEVFTAADYQYAWKIDGTELVDGDADSRSNGVFAVGGFDPNKGFGATPAIGDMDGDGDLEIANVAWTVDSLYVWDHLGQVVDGWPKTVLDDFNWASPAMSDLDGDSDLELIVWAAQGGRLFVWHHDGTEFADGDNNPATDGVLFRIFGTIYNYSSPAVADLDGDGNKEIIVAVNISGSDTGRIYAIQPDGSIKPGWPFETGSSSTPSQVTASPAVADVDGDGQFEVVICASRGGGQVYVIEPDGSLLSGWPRQAAAVPGLARTASPVPADVDGDGTPEIVFPASDGRLHVWDRFGNAWPGFPVTFMTGVAEATQSTPAIADVDGDGELEFLFGDESGKLHGYNDDGSQLDGFPIQLGGEVRSTPGLWDMDLDGQLEIVLTCWDASVYVWDLPGSFVPQRAPWPSFRHDSRNTGWALVAVLPIAVEDPMAPGTSPVAASRVHLPRPNPFNPQTTLAFDVAGEGARRVTVAIYDVGGRLVRQLLDGPVAAGRYEMVWDGRGANGRQLGTGIYLYRVSIDDLEVSGKLVMVK